MITEKKSGNITWYQFAGLNPYAHCLFHGCFTRQGGVSKGPWAGLNVGTMTGDDPGAVVENRQQILAIAGADRFAEVHQVHGDTIVVWDDLSRADQQGALLSADALVTGIKGLPLLMKTADCQAVMLYDPQNQVIANIHSGWRGSVQNICAKTVAVMQHRFGSDPGEMIAGISPSLGPCCAEFIHWKTELPQSFTEFMATGNLFDFWQITRKQLETAGLQKQHIEASGHCTVCASENRYYSYRKNKDKGRLANVIMLAG